MTVDTPTVVGVEYTPPGDDSVVFPKRFGAASVLRFGGFTPEY